jgi:hypothetical protein
VAVVDVVVDPLAAAVVVVVVAVLLTLGRVPTATRTVTATTKTMITATALTTESEPDVPGVGGSASIAGPACRATHADASLSAGAEGGGSQRPVT